MDICVESVSQGLEGLLDMRIMIKFLVVIVLFLGVH